MPDFFRIPLLLILVQFFSPVAVQAEPKNCVNETLNLLVGNHHLLHADMLNDSARFTEDGKILSVSVSTDESYHNTLIVTEANNKGKYKTIDPYAGKVYSGVEVKISSDGRYVSFTPPSKFESPPYLYDTSTDSLHPMKDFSKAENLEFSSNGKFVYGKLAEDQLGVFHIDQKNFQTIEMNKTPWNVVSLGDSSSVMVLSKRNLPLLVDLESGTKTKLSVPIGMKSIQSSSDGKTIVFSYSNQKSKLQTVVVYERDSNTMKSLPLKDAQNIHLLPNGEHLYYESGSKSILQDIHENKRLVLSSKYGSGFSASPDGKSLISKNADGSLLITNLVNQSSQRFMPVPKAEVIHFSFLKGSSTTAQIQFKSADHFYFGLWNTKTGELKKWEVPFNSAPIFSKSKDKVLFYFPDPAYFKGGNYAVYDLENLSLLTKRGSLPKSNLTEHFKKFAEPGAFKLSENANEVIYYFESGMFKKNKTLTQKMLLNVLSESTGMYESLVTRYSELGSVGFFAPRFLGEVNNPSNHLWKNAMKNYLDYFSATRSNSQSIVESMQYLKPIRNYFWNLNEGARNQYAEGVIDALADAAIENGFKGVFQSMIYKFSEVKTARMFGIHDKHITDITLVRKPYELKPVILGSKAINGDLKTQNAYGFFAKHLPTIKIPENAKVGDVILKDRIIPWAQDGKRFRAKLNIKVKGLSLDEVTPKVNQFHMEKLMKDKKLTGMMVVGSNLATEGTETIAAYEKYYLKNGFKFEEVNQTTNDLKTFMEEKISGGEVDYFIKQAHSDGDERNLVRIHHRAKIRKATRKMKNGNEEVVYLVYPTRAPKNYTNNRLTTLIANDDLASWMKKRIENGGEDLVYFNESCWSISKAIGEIESVFNKKFIEISSTMPVSMFENVKTNAHFNILNDFRIGETVAQMEKDAMLNAEYAHGTANTYTFYKDARFRKIVLDNTRPALDVDIELSEWTGSKWKIYNIDE